MASRSLKASRRLPSLGDETAAAFYAELSVLEDGGLPAQAAFEAVGKSLDPGKARADSVGARSRRAAASIGRGQSVAVAGRNAQLFSARDAALIEAASEGGRLAFAYRALADRYAHRHARGRKIRGQCLLPAFVLGIGTLANPLPALVLGELSPLGYVGVVVRMLVFVVAVVGAVLWVIRVARDDRDSAVGRMVGWFTLRLPLLGPNNSRRNVAQFLGEFGRFLDAGLPPDRAVKTSFPAPSNAHMAASFAKAAAPMAKGSTVEAAMGNIGLPATALGVIRSGEASGRLTQALERFSELELQEVEDFDDQVAAWLPRGFYALIVGYLLAQWL